jgi:hypothetical protein
MKGRYFSIRADICQFPWVVPGDDVEVVDHFVIVNKVSSRSYGEG